MRKNLLKAAAVILLIMGVLFPAAQKMTSVQEKNVRDALHVVLPMMKLLEESAVFSGGGLLSER